MTEEKKTLSLTSSSASATGAASTEGAKKGTLSLKGAPAGQQHITQTLARGQSRGVQIEVRKKRGAAAASEKEAAQAAEHNEDHLTNEEQEVRLRALQKAKEDDDRRREEEAKRRALEAEEEKMRVEAEKTGKRPGKIDADELRRREMEELELIKEEDRKKAEELDKQRKAQQKALEESRAAAAPVGVPGAYRPPRAA